jgi:hypothetical protein
VSRAPSGEGPALNRRERAIVERLRTPRQAQIWLRRTPYNYEASGKTLRTFRGVVAHGEAHCLEAALSAATILERHGFPPLLLSFESVDLLDHVIFPFRWNGLWGAVARSRDPGLHGRRPLYRSIRHLAWSYCAPYVDFSGRVTGYALCDLRELGNYDWRLSPRNVWKVEDWLREAPHRPLPMSDDRYRRLHARYVEFKRRFPHHKPASYPGDERWM